MKTLSSSDSRNTQSYSLPISLLRQFAFCPRIVYFQELLGLKPPEPLWVHQGSRYHQDLDKLFPRRRMERFGHVDARILRRQQVSSTVLGLHGMIDALLVSPASLSPVEFKLYGRKPTRGQILQIMAYGVAAAEQWQKEFRFAFFLFGKSSKPYYVEKTPELDRQLLKAAQQIRSILEDGLLPNSSATVYQCSQCEYLNHCNDRNV